MRKDSFKKYYGESVHGFIRSVHGFIRSVHSFIRKEKMNVAAGLLKETDSTVMSIAKQCVYTSASKFSEVFAEIMHVSPREYRGSI